MPSLPTASQKSDSILIGTNSTSSFSNDDGDVINTAGGKWEDEEERRFFEDVQDLKDFVPKSILGVEEGEGKDQESEESKEKRNERHEQDREYIKKLEEELEKLAEGGLPSTSQDEDEDEYVYVFSSLIQHSAYFKGPDTGTRDSEGHYPSPVFASTARSFAASNCSFDSASRCH